MYVKVLDSNRRDLFGKIFSATKKEQVSNVKSITNQDLTFFNRSIFCLKNKMGIIVEKKANE